MPPGQADERKTPKLPLPAVLSAISSPTRWMILRELAQNGQCAVVELAERLNETPTGVSKHMRVLLDAGIVDVGRNRLYSIKGEFMVDAKTVDLGWCALRLQSG